MFGIFRRDDQAGHANTKRDDESREMNLRLTRGARRCSEMGGGGVRTLYV